MQAFAIQVSGVEEVFSQPELLSQWQRLLDNRPHVNAMYASPSWIAQLSPQSGAEVHLALLTTTQNELVGVVPVQSGHYELQFAVSHRVLVRRKLPVARICGSLPIIPDNPLMYSNVFAAILRELPGCAGLHFDALPADSYLWNSFSNVLPHCPNVFLHITDGPRPWHLIKLTTFDDYLKAMSSKARANVRREVRHLREFANDKLELRKCTEPSQVSEFLKNAVTVSQRSWQHRSLGPRVLVDEDSRRYFERLAQHKLLHSYVLMADASPCAFVIGYRHAGVYHYAEVGFDEALKEFSPGAVLLYLILEDLHKTGEFHTLNFGIGDATYKRRYGNLQREDVGCLLLRNQIFTRLLTTGHSAFNKSVAIAKQLLNRKVTK